MNQTVVFWVNSVNELLKNISWPVVFIIAFFCIKKPLFALIQRIKHLKYQDLEAELAPIDDILSFVQLPKKDKESKTNDIFIDTKELAYSNPRGSIIRSWNTFEKLLCTKYPNLVIGTAMPRIPIGTLIEYFVETNQVPEDIVISLKALSRIRNMAIHNKNEDEFNKKEAMDFIKNLEKLYTYFNAIK